MIRDVIRKELPCCQLLFPDQPHPACSSSQQSFIQREVAAAMSVTFPGQPSCSETAPRESSPGPPQVSVMRRWHLLQTSSTAHLPTSPIRHVTPSIKLSCVTTVEFLATFQGFAENNNMSRALMDSTIYLTLRHLIVTNITPQSVTILPSHIS